MKKLIEQLGYLCADYLLEHLPKRKWRGKIVNNILFHLYLGASRAIRFEPFVHTGYWFDFNSYCDIRNYFLDDHDGLETLLRNTIWLDDGNYLDIGANNGYTCYLADKYGVDEIYAFEPEQEAFRRLFNNSDNHWHLHKTALSNVDSEKYLTLYDNDGAHTLNIDFADIQDNKVIDARIISLKRFDSLNIADEFKVCKIDVEGHELEVLEGMGDKIRNVEYFYIETSDVNFHDLKYFMSQNKYRQVDGPTKPPGRNRVANLTFERIERE